MSDVTCPICGRWLVRSHPDGTFDIAAQATVQMQMKVASPDGRTVALEPTRTATCLTCEQQRERLWARLKRFIKEH